MNPTTITEINGAHTNCSPAWNVLLSRIDEGLYGLQLIILKNINRLVPWKYQTEELIEELTQDCIIKLFSVMQTSTLKLNDSHPGPYVSVIVKNEILNRMAFYMESSDYLELEPGMVASNDEPEKNLERAELVKQVLESATPKESKVLSKIINDIPINHNERQCLYRLRARLEKQGVRAIV